MRVSRQERACGVNTNISRSDLSLDILEVKLGAPHLRSETTFWRMVSHLQHQFRPFQRYSPQYVTISSQNQVLFVLFLTTIQGLLDSSLVWGILLPSMSISTTLDWHDEKQRFFTPWLGKSSPHRAVIVPSRLEMFQLLEYWCGLSLLSSVVSLKECTMRELRFETS